MLQLRFVFKESIEYTQKNKTDKNNNSRRNKKLSDDRLVPKQDSSSSDMDSGNTKIKKVNPKLRINGQNIP